MAYGFICLDCGCDTYNWEIYSVHTELWISVFGEEQEINRGMLCIGCLEKRMGRKLTKKDFIDCRLNRSSDWHTKSPRLKNRLGLKQKGE